MKYLYVVRDNKAGDVGDQVMVCKADAQAVRAFTDALKNTQNFMSRYPEDYDLLCIGVMDEDGDWSDGSDGDRSYPCVILEGKAWKLSQSEDK